MPAVMSEPSLLLALVLVFAGLGYALVTAVLATMAAHAEHETAYHDRRVTARRRELERLRQQRERNP